MSTRLITNKQKLHTIRQIEESVVEPANTAYYLFIGNHIDDLSEVDIDECMLTVTEQSYRNMICGKRVADGDMAELIRNVPYDSGTVYDMYDDANTFLLSADFYVTVDEGSYNHVYKVLDNNNDSPSTIQPTFAHISGANTDYYKTSDGYVWKYMYSYDSITDRKFSTDDFIPVVANSEVSAMAVAGQIDVIKVEGQGRKYDNYITGTFSVSDLTIEGNTQIYKISNTIAKTSNGFYTGCVMYLSLGTGAGQHEPIIDYISNNSGNFVVIDSEFTEAPTNTTEYQIYPSVAIKSSGHVTTNAVARAMVNALASNSIYRIEMLEKGRGYDTYATATVVSNNAVGVQSNALLRVIMSPVRGHGFDAASELYSSHMEISVALNNNESNTIPVTNKFSQIGLLRDPVFANVAIEVSNAQGVFLSDETAYALAPYRLDAAATTNLNSNIVTLDLDDFNNNLSDGDMLFLHYNDDSLYQLTTLDSVVNATAIQMTINAYTTSANVSVYKANPTLVGVVSGTNTSHVSFATMYSEVPTGVLIVGNTSGAKFQANATIMNDKRKGFDTFIGMHSLLGNVVSGTFQENEIIYQSNINTANAVVHSVVTEDSGTRLYFTNQKEPFNVTGEIQGNTSLAIFDPVEYDYPDIKYGTGDVLFLENISPVTRSANTSETFQIIFAY